MNMYASLVGGGSSPPTGAAGGVLAGTYPNPGFANPLNFSGTVNLSGTTVTMGNSAQLIISGAICNLNAGQTGNLTLNAGSPTGTGNAGSISLVGTTGGNATSGAGAGGGTTISLQAGNGGNAFWSGSTSQAASAGGNITFTAGTGGFGTSGRAAGVGGTITLNGGTGGSAQGATGAGSDSKGGGISIVGGTAGSIATGAAGGDISITGGTGVGVGSGGTISIDSGPIGISGTLSLIKFGNTNATVINAGSSSATVNICGTVNINNTSGITTINISNTSGTTNFAGGITGLPYGKNAFINPSFDFWQRGTSSTSTGVKTADRILATWSLTCGAPTLSRSTDVPTVAQAGFALNFSYKYATTQQPENPLSGGHYAYFGQRIEGWIWKRYTQQTLTLSFWAKCSVSGTGCITLANNPAGTPDEVYTALYPITAANTWAKYSLVIPPSPAAGTWNYQNAAAVEVRWVVACSAANANVSGSWQNANFIGSSGVTSLASVSGASFQVTAIQLEIGSVATNYEERPYPLEYSLCQRYCQLIDYIPGGVAPNTTTAQFCIPLGQAMYTTPTVSATGLIQITNSTTANYTQSGTANASINDGTTRGVRINCANFTLSGVAQLTTGTVYQMVGGAGSVLLEAEM